MKISRPEVALEQVHRAYEFSQKAMHVGLANVRRRPSVLSLLASQAITTASCGSIIAPESEDIAAALKIASQSHAAIFALASKPNGPVTVALGDGDPITITGYQSESSVENAFRWLNGFYLAALCRDRDSLEILLKTPLEVLKRSSTRNPEYRFLLVEAIQMWRKGADGVARKFIATMEATDPEREDIIDEDYTLRLDVPAIQCLLYAITKDADFAKALVGAAESHKDYWVSTDELEWSGFLSIPLLGVAAIAHDRKLPFELDCDFVPMNLVRGEGFE
jgi:hypothetical protein